MKKIYILLLTVGLLAGCQPSETLIQTAIVQTQESQPTATLTVTPLPTSTPTILPTATPDTRLYDVDPRELLLEKSDLPPEGKYYLPNSNWIQNLPNKLVIASWTVEEGQEYIANSGRIHGWSVGYQRGTTNVLMPKEVIHTINLHSSIEGAAYALISSKEKNIEIGWTEIPSMFDIGDNSYFLKLPDGGEIRYLVSFQYKNTRHNLAVFGTEQELNEDFMRDICEMLIEKNNSYPLSDTVTFQP